MLNKTVTIVPSKELAELKLNNLVGQVGVALDKAKGNGYWVKLEYPYFNEIEWFIPTKSLKEYEG